MNNLGTETRKYKKIIQCKPKEALIICFLLIFSNNNASYSKSSSLDCNIIIIHVISLTIKKIRNEDKMK